MKTHCGICHLPLNNPFDSFSRDCGGNCLLCMAYTGDKDCAASVIMIRMNGVPEAMGALPDEDDDFMSPEDFQALCDGLEEVLAYMRKRDAE